MDVILHKTKPQDLANFDPEAMAGTQLTQEELAILYEEPEMITTNVMKAVHGFEPQDEKRNCPHYDPKTGRCFKGNACQLEHVAPLMGKQNDI